MTTFYDPYKIQMFFTALLRFYDKKSSVFAAGLPFDLYIRSQLLLVFPTMFYNIFSSNVY